MAAGAHHWRRAAFLAVAAAVLFAIGMHFEESLLYFPTRTLAASPKDYGLEAEDLAPKTEDGVRLFGWWIRGEGRRAVLFFHGNAGNAADRLERAKILRDRFGLDVFLVDYRGYGRSEGSPSEAGLARDARAVYDAARARGFPAGAARRLRRIARLGRGRGPRGRASLRRRRARDAVSVDPRHGPTPLSVRSGNPHPHAFRQRRAHRGGRRPQALPRRRKRRDRSARTGPPPLRARAAAQDALCDPGRAPQRHVRRRRRAYWQAVGGFLATLP